MSLKLPRLELKPVTSTVDSRISNGALTVTQGLEKRKTKEI